ncbi:MAG: YraN family protein [Proteobacteria bacterium]|nr:YraN family protein [Pseudomonadota bacterium]
MLSKREEGIQGEEKAIKVLKRKGYRIIGKNYRNPFGEIDIIAEEGGYLVFIEVKNRNTPTFGDPLDAINTKKKEHMIRSAMFYLKTNKCFERKVRFDVVGIDRESVKIVKHAFIVEQKQ